MLSIKSLAATTAFFGFTATGAMAADVSLWRLDCGDIQVNYLNLFSDTNAYDGEKKTLVGSCYLVKHDDAYLLWDAGLPAGLLDAAQDPDAPIAPTLKVDLPTQLAQLDLTPDDIDMIGISHYHFDHTGQAASFNGSKLLIGAEDFETLGMDPLPAHTAGFADPAPLQHWLSGDGETDLVRGDRDVFGDGTVMMLQMPGHTPGHRALMVNLAETGPVLLSGDTFHFLEQIELDGVPTFNFDRAQTLAANDRYRDLVENTGAVSIIQHDPRDIEKLPAFPEAAK